MALDLVPIDDTETPSIQPKKPKLDIKPLDLKPVAEATPAPKKLDLNPIVESAIAPIKKVYNAIPETVSNIATEANKAIEPFY